MPTLRSCAYCDATIFVDAGVRLDWPLLSTEHVCAVTFAERWLAEQRRGIL